MERPESDNISRFLMVLGFALIATGICVGLWAVTVVHSILYHPDDIPLLSRVLGAFEGSDEIGGATEGEEGFVVTASGVGKGIILLVFFLFLFGTLTGIIGSFISGGIKVLKAARSPKSGTDRATDET